MKRLFPILALFLSLEGHALTREGYGLLVGGDFGGLSESVASDSSTATEYDRKTGIFLSSFWDLPISRRFSFVPGISLVNKGGASSTFSYSLQYIEVPLLLRLNETMGTSNLFIWTGPAYGVLIGGDVTTISNGNRVGATGTIKSNEVSWLFGGGLDFDVDANWKMVVGSSLSFGLTGIQPNSQDADLKIKNMGIYVYVGFRVLPSGNYDNSESKALQFAKRKRARDLVRGVRPMEMEPLSSPEPVESSQILQSPPTENTAAVPAPVLVEPEPQPEPLAEPTEILQAE